MFELRLVETALPNPETIQAINALLSKVSDELRLA